MKDLSSESITSEERREAIERICASNEFKRAARLRDFLRYVGQRSLQGGQIQISEIEIGVHVFGRPENYDTSADNIVRVNASELRKRIAAYYATEGTDEQIFVDIPRGSYTPLFSLRSTGPTGDAQKPDAATQPQPKQAGPASPATEATVLWLIVRHHAALAAAILLAVACFYLAYQNHVLQNKFFPWKSEPTLDSFWSGILEAPRDTDVVVADTSVATVEFILKQHITLNDYLDHAYDEQIQSSDLSPQMRSDLEDIAARNNGSVSDFRVAQKILDLHPNSASVHLQFAREYRPRNATGHNIILIGSSVSNPWTSLFEDQLNFVIAYDSTAKQMVVQNRHPRPGESAVYTASMNSTASGADFSIVDYIPNQNHSADVLIIAGTSSEATEAAGDFLTKEDSMRHFADVLHAHTLPYFELLLKTTRLQGAPITAEILAYRTSPGHPLGAR